MESEPKSIKKGVGVLIRNDRGEFLLAQRGEKARSQIGYWENVGGGVEPGEEAEAAAIRETMEELGVKIDIIESLPAIEHTIPDKNEHWQSTSFVAQLKEDQIPTIMEEGKISTFNWFSLNNLPEPLSEASRADFEHYQRLHPNHSKFQHSYSGPAK